MSTMKYISIDMTMATQLNEVVAEVNRLRLALEQATQLVEVQKRTIIHLQSEMTRLQQEQPE